MNLSQRVLKEIEKIVADPNPRFRYGTENYMLRGGRMDVLLDGEVVTRRLLAFSLPRGAVILWPGEMLRDRRRGDIVVFGKVQLRLGLARYGGDPGLPEDAFDAVPDLCDPRADEQVVLDGEHRCRCGTGVKG